MGVLKKIRKVKDLEMEICRTNAHRDADTILEDIISDRETDVSGIALELFEMYETASKTDRKAMNAMFLAMTGTSFEEYLDEVIEVLVKQNENQDKNQYLIVINRGYGDIKNFNNAFYKCSSLSKENVCARCRQDVLAIMITMDAKVTSIKTKDGGFKSSGENCVYSVLVNANDGKTILANVYEIPSINKPLNDIVPYIPVDGEADEEVIKLLNNALESPF